MGPAMASYPEGIERLNGTGKGLKVGEEENDGNMMEQEEGEEREHEDENPPMSQYGKSNPAVIFTVRTGIGLVLFFLVLSCITFSKLSLIRLADRLRTLTVGKNVSSDSKEVSDELS